jgi:site-specific DNA-adenine methylase
MSHLCFNYSGNKRKEYKYIEDKFNFDGITNIIEPFCGSVAISFNIWLKHKDRFHYYINDKEKDLIDIYQMFKITEPDIIYNKIKDIGSRITNKELFIELHKKKNKNAFECLFRRMMSGVSIGWYRGNKYNTRKNFSPLQLLFLEFLRCNYVYISNNDWFDIFDIYKNDEKTIFIFDPPYINRDNRPYVNPTLKVYDYFKTNNINTFNSRIFFMLEDIPIIRELFIHNKFYEPYDKVYQMKSKDETKTRTKHIIISNHLL